MKDKEATKDLLRITNQVRTKRGMSYDLKCQTDRITLCMTPRSLPSDLGEWRVDASTGRADDGFMMSEWGATRTLALQALAKSWTSQAEAKGLAAFDWEAVALTLDAVRAL